MTLVDSQHPVCLLQMVVAKQCAILNKWSNMLKIVYFLDTMTFSIWRMQIGESYLEHGNLRP